MNAHHIPRVGMARMRDEHLQAANDECKRRCWLTPSDHPQGRRCACSTRATRRAYWQAFLWLTSAGAALAIWSFLFGLLTA